MNLKPSFKIAACFGMTLILGCRGSVREQVGNVDTNKPESPPMAGRSILPGWETSYIVEEYQTPAGDFALRKISSKKLSNDFTNKLLDYNSSIPCSEGPFFCSLGMIIALNKNGRAIYLVDCELSEARFAVYTVQTMEEISETGEVTVSYKIVANIGTWKNLSAAKMFLDTLQKEHPETIERIAKFLHRIDPHPVVEDYLTGRRKAN